MIPTDQHNRPSGRLNRWALTAVGVIVVAGLAAWQVYARVGNTSSSQSGPAMVRQSLGNGALSNPVRASIPSAGSANLTTCAESGHGSDPVKGLLEIPKLGVTAPVEQGSGDAQLDVAVGHDSYSVWPGAIGDSVLAAHDASYFVRLPELSAGDTILYVGPCTTYAFAVSGQKVVSSASAVHDTRAPALTLMTGWPTDALGSTSKRYLVTADEVSQSFTTGPSPQYLTVSPPPSVPVPSALAAQGLTLGPDALPMGTLSLTGSPDQTWSQTTNPLMAEGPAVRGYIAAVRSLTQKRLGWWNEVAPGVPPPAPLVGAQNPHYTSALDVTEFATGTRVDGLTLENEVTVSGGKAPGRYSITVGETIENGALLITRWSMQRL